MQNFKNSARQIKPRHEGYYAYDKPSPYLHVWSKLLQGVISIAATRMLTNKWHTEHCGIYKSEGGCNLPGEGWLILYDDCCIFDSRGGRSLPWRRQDKKKLDRCAQLISKVVLGWNPNDPITSIFVNAAEFIGETVDDLLAHVEGAYSDTPFDGNDLSRFFNHNPFCKFPVNRDYFRYCLVRINGRTDEEADQHFADEDLGDDLLGRMQKKLKSTGYVYCCSPQRDKHGLKFWINDGSPIAIGSINGWRTEEEIEAFIAS